ncbi:MAG: sulfurtransferase TusA family protein [Planctomycetota bacterium]
MTDADDERKTAELLQELDESGERTCGLCAARLCGHAYVVCVVMGFKRALRCSSCLAAQLGRDPAEFLEHVLEYIQRRACFSAGWMYASQQEGLAPGQRPSCLWPAAVNRSKTLEPASSLVASPVGADTEMAVHAEWDAGDMGCGDLVLELRGRLRALSAGQVLAVRARDPGAPQDIPAWCGLTGHELLRGEHPRYWIRRKDG